MLWQSLWSIRKRLPHPRKYRLPIEENIEEPFTRNDYRKQAIYRNGFHKSTQYDRRMALKTFGCVIGNGWCFISWNSKGITNKVPPSWSPSAEKLEKKSLFSAFCWNKTTICYDRAFLKRTTTNRWNASALGPTTEKQGKRAVFSLYTERKQSYSMTEAINSIP